MNTIVKPSGGTGRTDQKGRRLRPFIGSARELAAGLGRYCDWYSGVPDSMFRRVLPSLVPYYRAARENHALGMAFGARLGGSRPCVLMQNSGLGLSLDVALGLFGLYRLGALVVVAQRGELEWEEPQHKDWGEKTVPVLRAMDIPVYDFEQGRLDALALAAGTAFEDDRIAVLLIHRGNIDE
ncbi:MAG: hypothetical protein ACE15E_00400 [Acidobacteriota bacterium]